MPDPGKVIKILELLSGKKVIAITINTQNLTAQEALHASQEYESKYHIPAIIPMLDIERLGELVADCASQRQIIVD
jgi:Uncharacterized conserved protein, COG3367